CGCGGFNVTLTTIAPGDTIAVHKDDAAGRLLTTLHVDPLRVDRDQNTNRDTGDCAAGHYLPAFICVAACDLWGHIPNDRLAQQEADDFSLGLTTVTIPEIADTMPTPFESMFGPFFAFADTSTFTGPVTYPVSLTVDGTPASGDADTAAGISVTGLAVG